MASDDHPVRILYPDYKPAYASDMTEYLHKLAEGELEMGGEVPGKTNLYPDPGEQQDLKREDGPVRDRLGHETALQPSGAVVDQAGEVRNGLLGRTFDRFAPEAGTERAMMAANFEHVRSGQFEAHSAMMQPKTKQASLAEQVKKILR